MRTGLKTAVIGAGKMGQKHIRIFAESSKLIAIVDLNKKVGQSIAKKYNVKFYANYAEIFKKEKIDAVSIATPPCTHEQIAIDCLKNRIPVLLEKPISNIIQSAIKIVNEVKKNNILLLVGHIERFNPAVIKIKELINKEKLGKIICIVAKRVGGFPNKIQDASIDTDLAIHDIDIVNYLLDSNPNKIITNKKKNLNVNQVDSAEYFLLYKDISVFIQTSWISSEKIRRLEITGIRGYAEVDYINQTIVINRNSYKKYSDKNSTFSDYMLRFANPIKTYINFVKKEPLKEEIYYFLKCVKNKTIINPSYAVNALKIALGKLP
jgi:UDP-N-acetylglucosamine 3-dehydrogenase